MVKETQVNIYPSSLPIFVRLSRSCGVSVEIVQQTGHLIQSLLIAIDVGHCHHILPLTVQVEGVAVANQRRIRIYLERIGSSHHITRNRDGDAQSILFELHKGTSEESTYLYCIERSLFSGNASFTASAHCDQPCRLNNCSMSCHLLASVSYCAQVKCCAAAGIPASKLATARRAA